MRLQELVNILSNRLATMPSDTVVYVKVGDVQEITSEVVNETTEKGQIIIIK